MSEVSKMDLVRLEQQVDNLKSMVERQNLINDGLLAVLRKLIEANPAAVPVTDVEGDLNERQSAGSHFLASATRREEINDFLRDVGLMKRV